MSDQQDIVARLRAYTQHNKPVLSSDLKIAADYIEALQRELVAAIEQRNAARLDSDVAHKACHDLAGSIEILRAERDCLRAKTAGVAAEGHRPSTTAPPTDSERFDDIDRRIALLESSCRRTERRLALAAAKLADVSNWQCMGTVPNRAFMAVSDAILSVDKDGHE